MMMSKERRIARAPPDCSGTFSVPQANLAQTACNANGCRLKSDILRAVKFRKACDFSLIVYEIS
jgi:hypothetical protein